MVYTNVGAQLGLVRFGSSKCLFDSRDACELGECANEMDLVEFPSLRALAAAESNRQIELYEVVRQTGGA